MNKWVRRGMLVFVLISTYLFFIPGHGYGLQYTYPQNDDCGIYLLAWYTNTSKAEIYGMVGHNWTWQSNFESVLRKTGHHYHNTYLSPQNTGSFLLYQAHWYYVEAYEDYTPWGFDRGYWVYSDRGYGFLPASYIEGQSVLKVEQ